MIEITQIIIICMNVVTFLVSLVGNVSVIALLWRHLYLRDVDTVIHASLSISALIFCNICGIQWIFFFAELPSNFDIICSLCPFVNWANTLLLAFLFISRAVRLVKKDMVHSKKCGYVFVLSVTMMSVTAFVTLFVTKTNRCFFESETQSTKWFVAVIIRENILILSFIISQSLQFYRIYSNYKHLALGKKQGILFLRREKPAIIGSTILMLIFLIPRIITLCVYSHYVVYENISSPVFEFLRNFNQIPPALYPYAVVLMTRQFRPDFVALLKCMSKKSSKIFIAEPKSEEKMDNTVYDIKINPVDKKKEEDEFHNLEQLGVENVIPTGQAKTKKIIRVHVYTSASLKAKPRLSI